MAKDYKNTPKPKHKASKAAPGWLWMLAGLSIGLFVALLVYLKDYFLQSDARSTPAPVVDKSRPAERVVEKPASKTDNKTGNTSAQKPHFDFYNLLPEMEVFIPDQELAAERESPSDEKATYFLQVGSFRHFEDADRLRAQLALLSIESQIQRVTINDKQTWHRVRVGPFHSARKMDRVRGRLHEQSINPITIKVKG